MSEALRSPHPGMVGKSLCWAAPCSTRSVGLTSWTGVSGRVCGLPARAVVPRRARIPPVHHVPAVHCSAQSPPKLPITPKELRGMNETWPFYAALVGAQALPFIFTSRGLAVDVAYFSITALSALVIGCKRSPLQATELTAPLTKEQVLIAPVAASCFLFGAYLLLRYTPLDIGLVFNFMTTFAGGLCLKEALDPVMFSALSAIGLGNPGIVNLEKPEYAGEEVEQLLLSDGLSAGIALAVIACYITPSFPLHFVFSNVIAVGIASRVLALIRPDSFFAAAGLLGGLCLYDIFFVFGTDVMVTVALKIDSPGKLLFPRDPAAVAETVHKFPYAVLGLGDVCVPGIFVTLTLALDRFLVQKRLPDAAPSIVPAGPYFRAAVAAYLIGLGTCFGVNFTTSAAQPALLYLVPALISSSLIVGLSRGELAEVVKFRMPSIGGRVDTNADSAKEDAEVQ